mmetsp:Transcript_64861/g.198358  ORF Transcript_64861/g.198358 Transcript_64861/m.198358 type:complete len:208 (+) Transcript_64861:276-899(+)
MLSVQFTQCLMHLRQSCLPSPAGPKPSLQPKHPWSPALRQSLQPCPQASQVPLSVRPQPVLQLSHPPSAVQWQCGPAHCTHRLLLGAKSKPRSHSLHCDELCAHRRQCSTWHGSHVPSMLTPKPGLHPPTSHSSGLPQCKQFSGQGSQTPSPVRTAPGWHSSHRPGPALWHFSVHLAAHTVVTNSSEMAGAAASAPVSAFCAVTYTR